MRCDYSALGGLAGRPMTSCASASERGELCPRIPFQGLGFVDKAVRAPSVVALLSWMLVCLLLACLAAQGESVDLLTRYSTKLTAGDTAPDRARPWEFAADDVFRVSRFSFAVGKELKLELRSYDLGINHCADGAVWEIGRAHV